MAKALKNGKPKSTKLHLEMPRANWERVEAYLKAYNESDRRLTPRIKLAHVVNMALVQYLTGRGL